MSGVIANYQFFLAANSIHNPFDLLYQNIKTQEDQKYKLSTNPHLLNNSSHGQCLA